MHAIASIITRRHRSAFPALLLLMLDGRVASAACQQPPLTSTPATVELRHAHWFDGTRFREGARWIRGDCFVPRPVTPVDSIVDLGGQWVIPPYGDAHTHSPDGPYGFEPIRDLYLRLGVFYVQTLANHRSGREALAGRVGTPSSIDVAFADGAVTSSGGHPQVLYESLALFHRTYAATDSERIAAASSLTGDRDVYYRLDSLPQLPALVADLARDTVPILKVMLLGSEHWRDARSDSLRAPYRGVNPELLAPLVAAAHRLGRRVWVHVETARDFAVALKAGVDGFAHVPGYGSASEADSTLPEFILPDSLIRAAGRRHLPMTATLGLGWLTSTKDTAASRRYQAVAVRNARALRRAGVRLVSGSDTYSDGDAIRNDPLATATLLPLTPLERLRMRAVDTPMTIFPGRRIGQLKQGFEASLLVLDCDPLRTASCGEHITMRLKQGAWLSVPPESP